MEQPSWGGSGTVSTNADRLGCTLADRLTAIFRGAACCALFPHNLGGQAISSSPSSEEPQSASPAPAHPLPRRPHPRGQGSLHPAWLIGGVLAGEEDAAFAAADKRKERAHLARLEPGVGAARPLVLIPELRGSTLELVGQLGEGRRGLPDRQEQRALPDLR